MSRELTTEELRLVTRHGSNRFTQCLGAIQLARREDRLDELCELMTLDSRDTTSKLRLAGVDQH